MDDDFDFGDKVPPSFERMVCFRVQRFIVEGSRDFVICRSVFIASWY